jgi:hypothetical protein
VVGAGSRFGLTATASHQGMVHTRFAAWPEALSPKAEVSVAPSAWRVASSR